jgi:hypothetical protein
VLWADPGKWPNLPDILLCLVCSLHVAQNQLLRSQHMVRHGLLHLVNGGFFQVEMTTWWHWKECWCVSIVLQRK